MFLSKLIKVIQALDKDTHKRLDEYVHSPYFKVPAASVDLFDYLKPLYPNFPSDKIKPGAIAMAGGNLSTYAKAARAGSELLQTIEYFLALEDWQKHDMSVTWHQFNALQQLQLLGEFDMEFEKTLDKLNNDPEQDIEIFFYRHTFTDLASNGFDALLNRTNRNDLNPTLKTLDEFYALKLLRYMCEAVSRKQVLGIEYKEAQMILALQILEPYTTPQYPYPYLFVNVYKMLKAEKYREGKLYYGLIKQFIAEQNDILPISSIESMSYAINWCLYWNWKGYNETADEYLWWIELKIKHNLLLENEKILPITFRNTMVFAVASNRTIDWMQHFIKKYAPCLPIEHRNTNVAFAQGLYHYHAKEYTKAIQSFLTAQAKEEVIFNAIIRRWQYMSTYEQNPADTDLLLNQLQSFEKYLSRNKESLHHLKDVFILFISYAKKMLDVAGKAERLTLNSSLEQEPFFPESLGCYKNCYKGFGNSHSSLV